MTDESKVEQVHPAVELLLARMTSNPEKYVSTANAHKYDHYKQYLTKHEKELIKSKEREVHLNNMHKILMAAVLENKG